MPVSSCKSCLVTQVMAATPQRLQQMLVEAAIRFIERARKRWRAGEDESAVKAAIRAQQIVGEMLGGLEHELTSKLVRRAASAYLLAFCTLTEVCRSRDEKKLAGVLEVLKAQQEMWHIHPSPGTGKVGNLRAASVPVPEPSTNTAAFAQSANLGLPAEA